MMRRSTFGVSFYFWLTLVVFSLVQMVWAFGGHDFDRLVDKLFHFGISFAFFMEAAQFSLMAYMMRRVTASKVAAEKKKYGIDEGKGGG